MLPLQRVRLDCLRKEKANGLALRLSSFTTKSCSIYYLLHVIETVKYVSMCLVSRKYQYYFWVKFNSFQMYDVCVSPYFFHLM